MPLTTHIPKILQSPFYIAHRELLLSSFRKLLGSELIAAANTTDISIAELWDAPFVVVSHGIEDDPIFNFGNRVALELFELDFNNFIRLPSRKSAEPINRSKREQLLSEVSKNGFVKNYSGVRISSSGKRFAIDDAIIWNLINDAGDYCGQAATFSKWKSLQNGHDNDLTKI